MKLFEATIIFVALNSFLGEAALSISPPPKQQSSNIVKLEDNVPVCYMETTTGTTIDLSRLCEINPVKAPKINVASNRKQYNYKEIKNFNDQVYGEDE